MHPSEARITPFQLAMLLIPGIASTAVLGLPATTFGFAQQDAWLAPVIAAPAAVLAIWIAGRLARRFPGETFVEYAPKVLGTVPGKIAAALLWWYFFHLDAIVTREFGDFLIATSLARTPQGLIVGTGAIVAALAVRYGPEILGRLGELFTPIAAFAFVAVILMAVPNMEFAHMLPVFENGFRPVLSAAFVAQAFLGQFVLLTILLPSVSNLNHGLRASYTALTAIVLVVTVVSVASIAAFGPITGHLTWPFFKVARIASIGPVLSRIDPVVIGLWIGGTNLKMALHLYAATVCFAQLFELSDYRPIVLPMAALVAAYSTGHVLNSVEHGHMLSFFWPPYTQVFQLLIPAIVLAVAALRGLGGEPAWGDQARGNQARGNRARGNQARRNQA